MEIKKIRQFGEMVKFSHSIFALPFALASLMIASQGHPPFRILFLMILAMVALRTGAMAFNRWVDADIDAQNPRTAVRHIPQNILSKQSVLITSIFCGILFVILCTQINPLAFQLSPIALSAAYGYSLAKRFTSLSHIILGCVLGMSPIGAWVAMRGEVAFIPVLLGIAVTLWVAGFDLIYATQDYDFDKQSGLHSMVVALGISKALLLARLFHLLTLLLLLAFGILNHFGWTYFVTLSVIAGLFLYEHSLVSDKDLSKVNAAFFNVNGIISILFFVGVWISLPHPQ